MKVVDDRKKSKRGEHTVTRKQIDEWQRKDQARAKAQSRVGVKKRRQERGGPERA
jgi:hypothetical protein